MLFNARLLFKNGVLALLLAGSAALLCAQTPTGEIVGQVTDPSNSVVPGAKLTITNLATGFERRTETNGDGLYFAPLLPVGLYRVSVEKEGFRTFGESDVRLEVSQTLTIGFQLLLGRRSDTVEVRAIAPLLQPDTSSLGQVIDQRETNELPLNGRNPFNLGVLSPAVLPQGQSLRNPTGTNLFGFGNYQINGGMANQSTALLDGAPVTAAYGNVFALVPTQDSLQEFKVQTNDLPAEFGRFAGGVFNFTTKSGTNELHGGAWEFLRNKALNANDFFSNESGLPTPAFTQNQFGFNIGGPVYIPGIYNGRNKTFFFTDFESFRLRQGQTFTETVPTMAERQGDFAGSGATVYDPLTTCGVPGYPTCVSGQAQYDRQPFLNDVIPQARWNLTGEKLLLLFPLPNVPGSGNGVNNYATAASAGGNNDQTVVHIDHVVSEEQRLSARYSYWTNLNLPVDPLKNGVQAQSEAFNTNSFVLDDVDMLRPTTILEVNLSYQRFSYGRLPTTHNYDLTNIGWPTSLIDQMDYTALPDYCPSGYAGNVLCQGGEGFITARNDDYRAAASLLKLVEKHSFKFGGEFLRMTDNFAQAGNVSGSFNFNPDFTASNPNDPTGGSSLASLLLGDASNGSIGKYSFVAAQQLSPALFAQDDWHVTPRLTLNLGLRWEFVGPWTERFNRISYFDPSEPNPILSAANLNYNGAIGLVDSPGYPYRSNMKPDYRQFSPRVGLAFQLTPRTVLRGGYGIVWLPNDANWSLIPNNDELNSTSTSYVASLNNGITPYGNLSNPFPQGLIPAPGRSPVYQQDFLGQNITEALTNNKYPYIQQWNFDIQRGFGSSFLLDVSYAGSEGVHLPFWSLNINQLPDRDLALGNQLFTPVANPFSGVVTFGSLAASTVPYGQLLRPYPEYGNVLVAGPDVAASSYNSLQVKAQKRLGDGGSLLLAYTHSKLISDTDALTAWLEPAQAGQPSIGGAYGAVQDSNSIRGERSLSSNDAPDHLVFGYVVDLPVGRGRRLLSHPSPLINTVVGGWGLDGMITLQSGFPLFFATASNVTNSFGGGSRPNVLAGCQKSVSGSAESRLNDWFNKACFSQPPAFTFGTEPRTDPNLRSDGIANWDFAAFKNFAFADDGKVKVQFRGEFFNFLNHPQFGAPGTTLGAAGFGVVSSQINSPRLVQLALRMSY